MFTSPGRHAQLLQPHVFLQPIFTKQLLLRGQYQTLPLAIYGWVLAAAPTLKVCVDILSMLLPDPGNGRSMTHAMANAG